MFHIHESLRSFNCSHMASLLHLCYSDDPAIHVILFLPPQYRHWKIHDESKIMCKPSTVGLKCPVKKSTPGLYVHKMTQMQFWKNWVVTKWKMRVSSIHRSRDPASLSASSNLSCVSSHLTSFHFRSHSFEPSKLWVSQSLPVIIFRQWI